MLMNLTGAAGAPYIQVSHHNLRPKPERAKRGGVTEVRSVAGVIELFLSPLVNETVEC